MTGRKISSEPYAVATALQPHENSRLVSETVNFEKTDYQNLEYRENPVLVLTMPGHTLVVCAFGILPAARQAGIQPGAILKNWTKKEDTGDESEAD